MRILLWQRCHYPSDKWTLVHQLEFNYTEEQRIKAKVRIFFCEGTVKNGNRKLLSSLFLLPMAVVANLLFLWSMGERRKGKNADARKGMENSEYTNRRAWLLTERTLNTQYHCTPHLQKKTITTMVTPVQNCLWSDLPPACGETMVEDSWANISLLGCCWPVNRRKKLWWGATNGPKTTWEALRRTTFVSRATKRPLTSTRSTRFKFTPGGVATYR